MKLTIETHHRNNGNVSVSITTPSGIGFHAEADDVKTALIQCYAKVLNWMWNRKSLTPKP